MRIPLAVAALRPVLVGTVALVTLAAGSVAAAPQAFAEPPASAVSRAVGSVDTSDRDAVTAAYREVYLPNVRVTAPAADPADVDACRAGETPAVLQQATLQLVNYFRGMSGVSPVDLDPTLSTKAQQAALMMYAQQDLSHSPDADWPCYSPDGADAAAHSDLGLGFRGADAVAAYMADAGSSNATAGHRWWLQRPTTTTMGNGSVGTANALWVDGAAGGDPAPPFVSWPSAGWFPAPLEPAGRWSVTATDPAYDLGQATVTVTGPDGRDLPLTTHAGQSGSLVLELGALPAPRGTASADYAVTVSGVRDGDTTLDPYRYTVSLFDPDAAAPVLTATAPPSVQGTPQVGATLRASAPSWSQDDVTTTYQWLRDGTVIGSATADSLELGAADVGHRMAVRATGTAGDLGPVSVDSAAVGPVTKVPAVLTVTGSSAARGRWSLTVDLSAPGEPPVDGTVTVTEGSTRVGTVSVRDGHGTLEKSGLQAGSHRYLVSYAGSDRIGATSQRLTVAVAAKTRPVLTAKASSTSPGAVTITIAVRATGESPLGGTVKVKDGSRTLASKLKVSKGTATFHGSALRAGAHTFALTYSGTSRVTTATASVATDVMAKLATQMTLKGSSPAAGQITIKVHVAAAGQRKLGGTAKVKEGGKTLTAKLKIKNGTATYSRSKVKAGTHTYTVTYGGTSVVTSASGTVTITVKAAVRMKSYANCDAMHQDYPHGVGRTDADDSTSGTPVTNFFRNNTLYSYNDGKNRHSGEKDLDRDNDGIACESD